MTLASQARSQRVFYNHPVQDDQRVRACQSQGAELSRADARGEPVAATKRAFVDLILKGPFSLEPFLFSWSICKELPSGAESLMDTDGAVLWGSAQPPDHSLRMADLLTLTLEQLGFSGGGEGDFLCTACFWQPRAAQSPAGNAEPHIHPHIQQPMGGTYLLLPPQRDAACPTACH